MSLKRMLTFLMVLLYSVTHMLSLLWIWRKQMKLFILFFIQEIKSLIL